MNRYLLISAALLVLAGCGAATHDPDQQEWVQLFDGETLDGWGAKITGYEPGENFGNTFRVEDGLLSVRYDAY
jgi:hypothetical protein